MARSPEQLDHNLIPSYAPSFSDRCQDSGESANPQRIMQWHCDVVLKRSATSQPHMAAVCREGW
jgi:hypothetical protein